MKIHFSYRWNATPNRSKAFALCGGTPPVPGRTSYGWQTEPRNWRVDRRIASFQFDGCNRRCGAGCNAARPMGRAQCHEWRCGRRFRLRRCGCRGRSRGSAGGGLRASASRRRSSAGPGGPARAYSGSSGRAGELGIGHQSAAARSYCRRCCGGALFAASPQAQPFEQPRVTRNPRSRSDQKG